MSELDKKIDEILSTLVRDVAGGVHGLYRGDTRQQTTQLRLSTFGREAGDKIRAAVRSELGAPSAGLAPPERIGAGPPHGGGVGAAAPLTGEEIGALTRCVMAWLPLGGAPNAATPEMKCVSGAREMSPTWGDRETARLALRRVTS